MLLLILWAVECIFLLKRRILIYFIITHVCVSLVSLYCFYYTSKWPNLVECVIFVRLCETWPNSPRRWTGLDEFTQAVGALLVGVTTGDGDWPVVALMEGLRCSVVLSLQNKHISEKLTPCIGKNEENLVETTDIEWNWGHILFASV